MTRTLLLGLLVVAGLTGCARRAVVPDSASAANPNTPRAPAKPGPGDTRQASPDDASQALATLNAPPIYFTLDSATLPSEAVDELEHLAQALRQRSLAKVTVSGHTCELGTSEYNVALGQRRAASVRAALVRLGVESSRISVVSYGEERPADVDAPAKNRRAEFSFRLAEQAHAGDL